jgi:hypothetical protein
MILQWDTPSAAALNPLRSPEMIVVMLTKCPPVLQVLIVSLMAMLNSLATMPRPSRPRMMAGRKLHSSTRKGTWRLSSKQNHILLALSLFFCALRYSNS